MREAVLQWTDVQEDGQQKIITVVATNVLITSKSEGGIQTSNSHWSLLLGGCRLNTIRYTASIGFSMGKVFSRSTQRTSLEPGTPHPLRQVLPYSINLDDEVDGGDVVVGTGHSVIRRGTLRSSSKVIAVKTYLQRDSTATKVKAFRNAQWLYSPVHSTSMRYTSGPSFGTRTSYHC